MVKSPFTTDAENGALIAWAMDDPKRSTFERQTTMRKAVQLLLAENPREITIALYGDAVERAAAAQLAVYVAWVNGVRMPVRKKKPEGDPLKLVRLYGHEEADDFGSVRAKATL